MMEGLINGTFTEKETAFQFGDYSFCFQVTYNRHFRRTLLIPNPSSMNAHYPHLACIEKSIIGGLHFPLQDVLNSAETIDQRRADAERGMLLGNNYKGKVKIIFEDNEGTKQVETTIWSVTETWVLLKTGMGIPIRRIYEVRI